MAGVLEQIRRSRRKLVRNGTSTAKKDQKVLELQAAIEILAEVFGINVLEIDEMLKLRYQECVRGCVPSLRKMQGEALLKHRYNETAEWPLEFCMAE